MRIAKFKSAAAVAALMSSLMLPGLAHAEGEITVSDPYARASTMMSSSGAAFMVIENHTAADDRLVSASAGIAERVELHTHVADANGVMQMIEVPEGFVIPAGGSHALQRGGDHVMFLGLTQPLAQGDIIPVTLTFETAGEVVVEVPVDLERKPMHGQMQGQGKMQMGAPDN